MTLRRLAQVLALAAGADDVADRLLDAAPVVLFGNGGGGLVDAAVLEGVDVAGNVVLPGRVGNDLFILEHELVAVEELVVGGGGAQAGLFGAVGAVGVAAVLEVELDLVEALLADEVVCVTTSAAGSQVAPVDDGVDEAVRVAAQAAAALDAADALEAQGVPDAAAGDVCLVDEVEDAVGVAQARGPVNVRLAHEPAGAAVAGGARDEEPAVAHVAAAARVVGLDEEAAQAHARPVLVVGDGVGAANVAQQHDGAKVLEPVVGEPFGREGLGHRVRVAQLNLAVDLVAEIQQQRRGQLVPRRHGHNRRHRLAVAQRHLARHDVGWQRRAGRVWERRLARDAEDGGAGRVLDGRRHGCGAVRCGGP